MNESERHLVEVAGAATWYTWNIRFCYSEIRMFATLTGRE